jgi:hypothetical protein
MPSPVHLSRRGALAAGVLLAAPGVGARKKKPKTKPPLAFVQATVASVTLNLSDPGNPRFVAQLSGEGFEPARATVIDMNIGLFVPADAGARARETLVGLVAGQASAGFSQAGIVIPADRISVTLY